MIKKMVLAAGIAAVLAMPVMAAEEAITLSEKIDRVDEVIYGSAQSGSLLDRVGEADNVIYGEGYTSASGLDNRIDNLYADVVKNDNDQTPSIANRMNAMEYYLTDEVSVDALENRMNILESDVYGKEKTGALDQRLATLETDVYGEQHYEMKTVELPKDTVFKISLNDEVSSKANKVGDSVTFTVQEDVLVGDVLVLPRGAQGSGVVTKVSRPKSFGRSGAVDISFDQVFSVDDESIPTVLGPEAKDKLKMEAAAVGASVIGALALGPVGLVGGLFVKGKDAVLPVGSELYIQTSEAVQTKGLVLKEGVSKAILRKRVSRQAVTTETSADDVTVEVTSNSTENSTVSKASTTATTKKAIAAKKAAAKTMSAEAKAELEAAREKTSAAKTAAESDDASVVIVRNE